MISEDRSNDRRFRDSAGIFVFRQAAVSGMPEVLMVRETEDLWGFPKGHIEDGETEQEAALREVYEETGIRAEIIGDFRIAVPSSSKDEDRKIIFFLGESRGGELKAGSGEVYEAAWIPVDRAGGLVRYPVDFRAFREGWQEAAFCLPCLLNKD